MYSRITLLEFDPVRFDVGDALVRFEASVVPALQEQRGTKARSCSPTTTRRMVVTLWASREAADDALASGFWAAQVEQFVTLFRSPPGRDGYDVVYMEAFGRRHPERCGERDLRRAGGHAGDSPCSLVGGRTCGRRRACIAQPDPAQARSTEHAAPRRALGTDRRRADARDGDHRCRSRHRRHDGSTIRSYVVRALGPTDVLVSAKGTDAESIWNPAAASAQVRWLDFPRMSAYGTRRRSPRSWTALHRRFSRRWRCGINQRQNEPRVMLFASEPRALDGFATISAGGARCRSATSDNARFT